MTDALKHLLTHLDLDQEDTDRYRGSVTPERGRRAIYGGHVIAQALAAAGRTTPDAPAASGPPGWRAHSLHAYFLRPGDLSLPIHYAVDRVRDGRSFVTRRVDASQSGRTILTMTASFHVSEPGLTHQVAMPEVPGPEQCPTWQERLATIEDSLPPAVVNRLSRERPIEARPVEPMDFVDPKPLATHQNLWMRANGTLPDAPALHQCVAAFASDSTLMDAMMRPHGKTFLSPDIRAASLDHSVWLHRPFRMDEWVLFHQQSPAAFGARGLAFGHFFTRDGVLVASVAQEGLFRLVDARRG